MTYLIASLVAFLDARLDEEEAAAKGPPGWKLEHWSAVRYKISDSGREWRVDAEPRCIVDATARDDAEHIARYDPARVLREVEANRAIVRRCAARMDEMDVYPNALVSPRAVLARQALMDLAAVWNDHPDYDQDWKP